MDESKNSKRRYHVLDWKRYNKGLCQRYHLDFWMTESVIKNWYYRPKKKKQGSCLTYSRTALLVCHQLRTLFNLSLRGTQGFLESFFKQAGIDLKCPHYSILCRRQGDLSGIKLPRPNSQGALFAAVDSTGLKVYGKGEWHVYMHKSSKRRTWRKIHLVVDPASQEILVEQMTSLRTHDAKAFLTMIPKLPASVKQLWGDGAYNREEIYKALYDKKIYPIIPPAQNSVASCHYRRTRKNLGRTRLLHPLPHMIPRDRALEYINMLPSKKEGFQRWKKHSLYHLRSLVETTMMRFKQLFSDKLRARTFKNQKAELTIKCSLLNHFLKIASAHSSPIPEL